jgi:hypothetical protein
MKISGAPGACPFLPLISWALCPLFAPLIFGQKGHCPKKSAKKGKSKKEKIK